MVAKRKSGLGRGLAELLGEAATVEAGRPLADQTGAAAVAQDPTPPIAGAPSRPADEATASAVLASRPGVTGVVDVPISAVRPNPRQPRRSFDREALDELARSIDALGMVQPVIVRPVADGYELIAGERRWRAAQRAGFTVIPAILREASDVESLEIALVENVVRQQLNPVDEAYALQVLLEDLGVTQEMLAGRIGKSRSAIANKVRLLELPPQVQELLIAGSLSEGHGRALLGLRARGDQIRLARKAAERGMSVRAVEAEVRRAVEREETPVEAQRGLEMPPGLLDSVRDAFYGATGVVPHVRLTGRGGRIVLKFSDPAELEAIVGRLSGGTVAS